MPSLPVRVMVPLVLCTLIVLSSFQSVESLANLSRIESFLLKSRLSKISSAVTAKFESEVAPSLLFGGVGQKEESDSCQERDVTIIFPGAGGQDDLSDELEDSLRRNAILSSGTSDTSNAVTTFDWAEHRGTVLTAAYDSETVGESVAKSLWDIAENKGVGIRSVHCIGISVGAFAANGIATEICRLRDMNGGGAGRRTTSSLYVRLTLLDPFTSRGVTGQSYGPANFGKCADYAVQYMNTDDPVPTTNDPLPKCVCYDVTNSKSRDVFVLPDGESLHCWPVAFYARHGVVEESGEGRGLIRHGDGNGLERGAVIAVD